MKNIELVIKIDEELYKTIQTDIYKLDIENTGHIILRAIEDGYVLPENHGKIVDLGNIDKDKIEQDNPIITISINGSEIEAVSLDYLYNLPDLTKKEK